MNEKELAAGYITSIEIKADALKQEIDLFFQEYKQRENFLSLVESSIKTKINHFEKYYNMSYPNGLNNQYYLGECFVQTISATLNLNQHLQNLIQGYLDENKIH
jgi:lysozyme family protein